MKIRVPYLNGGQLKYEPTMVGAVQLPELERKLKEGGMCLIRTGKTLLLNWDYCWSMIDDQDEWERGQRQERLLKGLGLL